MAALVLLDFLPVSEGLAGLPEEGDTSNPGMHVEA